jgi:hypothetical protein
LVKQIDFPPVAMQELGHLDHLSEPMKVVEEPMMLVMEEVVVQEWKVMEEHLQC